MSLRRLEILQWFGLLAGALVWAAAHVVGFGITEAECNSAGLHWGIQNSVWQGALMAAAAGLGHGHDRNSRSAPRDYQPRQPEARIVTV